MTRPNPVSILLVALLLLIANATFVPQLTFAQAEKYFPASTKGYVSITNLNDLIKRLDSTSFGDLRRTSEAKEFFQSFVKEVKLRIQKKSKVSLGLSLDELRDIVNGEVAIGLIQPKENVLAVITLAEFKKADAADKALATIHKNLMKIKEGDETVTLVQKITEGGQTISHYEFPDPFGIDGPPQVFYGRTDRYIVSYSGLVLADTKKEEHVDQVKLLLKALAGEKHASLAERELYKTTMKNLQDGDKYSKPQAKWFVESFGFVDAAKKAWPDQFKDMRFGAFRNVGFDAIKGAAGIGMIAQGGRDVHIRAFLFAPPVDAKNRFIKAAKMLDFTADDNRLLSIPGWVSNTASSYLAVHGRMLKAFDAAEVLVDELYSEGTMKQILDNFLYNPKLKANFDLRNELAANLGDRIVAIRDPKFPASLENRRVVIAIDIAKENNPTSNSPPVPKDKAAPKDKAKDKSAAKAKKDDKKLSRREQVYKVLKGYMANEDPNFIERIEHKVNGKTITIFKKITPKEDAGGDPDGLNLDDLDDLDDLDELDGEVEKKAKPGAGGAGGDPIIKYMCYAQYKDQVLVSPDLAFMKQVLDRFGKNEKSTLGSLPWFQRVNQELDKVKSKGFESLRYALRLDLPYKAAFQLIKESKGDLPIEKMLKRYFEEDEETRLFDISKLPKDFDKSVSPHLGYIGWSMTTEDNGWMFNGILLPKKKK